MTPVRLIWTDTALADLDRLELFLIDKNPAAATRAVSSILDATVQLRNFPNSGRPTLDFDLEYRELLVSFSSGGGYVVHYRFDGELVEVLDVRHQREAGY